MSGHAQIPNYQQSKQQQHQMSFYHHQHQQQHNQHQQHQHQLAHPQSSQPDSAGINRNQASLVVGLCGGTPVREDTAKLKPDNNGLSPTVIIATPGRLLDLATRNVLDLSSVRYFVIDECDRILDMGMEEQLRRIVAMITIK